MVWHCVDFPPQKRRGLPLGRAITNVAHVDARHLLPVLKPAESASQMTLVMKKYRTYTAYLRDDTYDQGRHDYQTLTFPENLVRSKLRI